MSTYVQTEAFSPRAQIVVSPTVWAWQVSAIISMLVFTSFSSLDVYFSALFFDGTRFPAAHLALFEVLRQVIWIAMILITLFCLFGLCIGVFRRSFLTLPCRIWSYCTLLVVIGPGLVVNEGLKQFWGRARPADILEFGGTKVFSPALVPSDQCAQNCSFVSGEGSGAVSLAILTWTLTAKMQNPALRASLRISAILAALIGSFLRVATGRHFLSDIIFAALLVMGIALLLRPILFGRAQTKVWTNFSLVEILPRRPYRQNRRKK